MSKRHPSRTAVRLMPPTTTSDSSTVDVAPRFESMYAAVSPAGPAPITTISCGRSDDVEVFSVLVTRSFLLRCGDRPFGPRAEAVYGRAPSRGYSERAVSRSEPEPLQRRAFSRAALYGALASTPVFLFIL